MAEIFKAYDVRGVVPDDLDAQKAAQIARAFVAFLAKKPETGNVKIMVGRDARASSDEIAEAVINALSKAGADVVDLGHVSTCLYYWAVIEDKADGGIMITASHNPAQYNGLKLCGPKAGPIGAETGLMDIKKLSESELSDAAQPGLISKKNFLEPYIEFLKLVSDYQNIKPLRLIIDCANGMIGPELTELLKVLPCRAEIMYAEPDGTFPNHEADPSKPENVRELSEKIKAGQYDLGIAFDGDGDRIMFLDEKGESLRGDFTTALIARELLKKHPNEKVLFEVRSSRIVADVVRQDGGAPVLGRAGHSLIKDQMRKEDILFGGELSGHYFYKKLGFIENTLFTMLEMLRLLSEEGRPLSEIAAPLRKYFVSGEMNFKVADPDAILAKAEASFSDAQIKKIDGVTVEYSDWWFNLRKSNTEPLVRLNIEADTLPLLEEKKAELNNLITG